MSHGKIRENKTCLNCGHQVEERFCPHCGQENIETRQPAYYLFTHFIEDFTHYDGQFWKTIKYLLFRPGKLTKEYLAGRRQMYVAPVKLYIFISFITFFIPAVLPKTGESHEDSPGKTRISKADREKQQQQITEISDSLQNHLTLENEKAKAITQKVLDNIKEEQKESEESGISATDDKIFVLGAQNMKEYDSLEKVKKSRAYDFLRPYAKKTFDLQESGLSKDEITNRFKETFLHTLPKALFVYLPVFAFFLWIFHNKKKWWYFDHSIFTLHYFSFLLLSILIYTIGKKIIDFLPDYSFISLISGLAATAIIIYTFIYFFIAHHRVYETRRRMSILKGSVLFIVNFIGLLMMFVLLIYISFMMMH